MSSISEQRTRFRVLKYTRAAQRGMRFFFLFFFAPYTNINAAADTLTGRVFYGKFDLYSLQKKKKITERISNVTTKGFVL